MTMKDRRGFLGLMLGVVAAGAACTALAGTAEAATVIADESAMEPTQGRRRGGRGGGGRRGRRGGGGGGGRIVIVQPRRRRRRRGILRILRNL